MEVVIIGGGLVGLGTALALARTRSVQVTVIEKERSLGTHQSTHNSGVLHAGLYYQPGSEKARLAVRGIRQMVEFAREKGIRHEICGKIVVACSPAEEPRLEVLIARGEQNGLKGIRRLSQAEVREREPAVRCVAAALVPQEGIIDYAGVVDAMAASLREAGHELLLSAPLTEAARDRRKWRIRAGDLERTADFVVNCAGLQSDRVARRLGASIDIRIVPFRGEYFNLVQARSNLVRHLVYPVPDPAFPFLGVHFTRMVRGGVECGPNAVLSLHREGYRRGMIRLADAVSALSFPGLGRFVLNHPRATLFELKRSLSKRVFVESLRRLVPDLSASDISPGASGVRAQAMRRDGSLIDDFQFVEGDGMLNVLNAPSPAATASLAIGEVVAERCLRTLGVHRRGDVK